MNAKHIFDVAIAGGGLTGLTLGLALKQAGLDVCIIDAQPAQTQTLPAYDGRASALAYTSWRLLKSIGVAELIDDQVQPIKDILVVDGRPYDGVKKGGPGPDQLHFDHREIAKEDTFEPLGWMAENRHIRQALIKASDISDLTRFNPEHIIGKTDALNAYTDLELESGKTIRAQLIIACDGKFSRLRQQAGIRTMGRDYNQKGLVLSVEHECPHDGVAYEYFMPSGPFAILPLAGNRSSLVWTERSASADALKEMNEADFQQALEARFGDFLGWVKPVTQRWVYPLGLKLAETFISDRLALLGDAARTIHPIAGQGFNLGIRDAAVLSDILVEAKRAGLDLGSAQVLQRYNRWRKTDSVALSLGTDVFNLLFSNDHSFIRLGRGLGMRVIDNIPAARRFFMRTAGGDIGDLPTLLRGERLRL